ncbi:hypothetical protein SNEBB_005415 [Seison nebaliae]|nr:hypothetical protein SNEBB_005415 [Seison nebaliae]
MIRRQLTGDMMKKNMYTFSFAVDYLGTAVALPREFMYEATLSWLVSDTYLQNMVQGFLKKDVIDSSKVTDFLGTVFLLISPQENELKVVQNKYISDNSNVNVEDFNLFTHQLTEVKCFRSYTLGSLPDRKVFGYLYPNKDGKETKSIYLFATHKASIIPAMKEHIDEAGRYVVNRGLTVLKNTWLGCSAFEVKYLGKGTMVKKNLIPTDIDILYTKLEKFKKKNVINTKNENSTFLLTISNRNLRIICPNTKMIMLEKHICELRHFIGATKQKQIFGLISEDYKTTDVAFLTYIFRCQEEKIKLDILERLNNEEKTARNELDNFCFSCPMFQYVQLCHIIDEMKQDPNVDDDHIDSYLCGRVNSMDADDRIIIHGKIFIYEIHSSAGQNELHMAAIRHICQQNQKSHIHQNKIWSQVICDMLKENNIKNTKEEIIGENIQNLFYYHQKFYEDEGYIHKYPSEKNEYFNYFFDGNLIQLYWKKYDHQQLHPQSLMRSQSVTKMKKKNFLSLFQSKSVQVDQVPEIQEPSNSSDIIEDYEDLEFCLFREKNLESPSSIKETDSDKYIPIAVTHRIKHFHTNIPEENKILQRSLTEKKINSDEDDDEFQSPVRRSVSIEALNQDRRLSIIYLSKLQGKPKVNQHFPKLKEIAESVDNSPSGYNEENEDDNGTLDYSYGALPTNDNKIQEARRFSVFPTDKNGYTPKLIGTPDLYHERRNTAIACRNNMISSHTLQDDTLDLNTLVNLEVENRISHGTITQDDDFTDDKKKMKKYLSYKLLWKTVISEIITLVRMVEKRKSAHKKLVSILSIREPNIVRSNDKVFYEETMMNVNKCKEDWKEVLDDPTTLQPFIKLKQLVVKGVPISERFKIWKYLGQQYQLREKKRNYKNPRLSRISIGDIPKNIERTEFFHEYDLNENYKSLLNELTNHQHGILIDLGRTFPDHDYFRDELGEGQLAMFNILKAYSIADNEVGYCQGLSYIVGFLLMHCQEEEECFNLFNHLMVNMNLRFNYINDLQGLQKCFYRLARILSEYSQDLLRHLLSLDVSLKLFATPWIICLYAGKFPLQFAARFFDLLFLYGEEAIYRMSTALLLSQQLDIISIKSFESMANFFQTELVECAEFDVENIVQQATSYDLSEVLQKIENELNDNASIGQYETDKQEEFMRQESEEKKQEELLSKYEQLETENVTLKSYNEVLSDFNNRNKKEIQKLKHLLANKNSQILQLKSTETKDAIRIAALENSLKKLMKRLKSHDEFDIYSLDFDVNHIDNQSLGVSVSDSDSELTSTRRTINYTKHHSQDKMRNRQSLPLFTLKPLSLMKMNIENSNH